MTKQKSAEEIVEAFEAYASQLQAIPMNADGQPNISAMSRACGFDRKRFATNPQLAQALRRQIKAKGLAAVDGSENQEDKALRKAKTEIKNLRERIDVMQQEIAAANARIRELEERLRTNSAAEHSLERVADLFLDTGRMPR